MPILASVNFTDNRRPPVVRPDVDHRRLDFADVTTGTVLSIFDESATARAFVALDGLTGLRIAPRRATETEYPGLEGARLKQVKRLPRDVVVPLFVEARNGRIQTHLDQLEQLRQVMAFHTNDYATDEGNLDLIATGQDGEQRRLRCYYVDGMEGAEGFSAGGATFWSMFDVKVRAVHPLWVGAEWSTKTLTLPAVVPFLSNDPADAFPRQLTASVAIGADMPLTVPGDLPSPAIVELYGPATETTISAPSGLSVTVGALVEGDLFILDTGRNRSATLNGDSAWDLIGQSPKWPALQPGETTISIEMAGATEDSRARVYGVALWETAW